MIENAHEENEVPSALHPSEIIDLPTLKAANFVQPQHGGSPSGLRQIVGVSINAQHLRAASRQLEGVEAGIAANIEDFPAAEIHRQMGRQLLPLPVRKVAEMMVGEGLNRVREVDVMEPWAQALNVF